MKWACGLNDGAVHYAAYVEMLCVAVHTARRYDTGLEPYLLYSGPASPETERLSALGFTIIPCRSFVADRLRALAAAENYPEAWKYGEGVFLRLELPMLAQRLGWDDEHLLYTDCDVMFTPRFHARDLPRPTRNFAVAPECDGADWNNFNSGIMVMHLPSMRAIDGPLREQVVADLPLSVRQDWDQYTLRRFFRGQAEQLDRLFNWKPYWGPNPDARIIHFHGPKPFVRRYFEANCAPPGFAELAPENYWEMCRHWDAELQSCLASLER